MQPNGAESRSLSPATSREGIATSFYPINSTALPNVTEAAALRIADLFACCRVVADGVATLPARVYRDTPGGRVPAGDDQRLVQLLRRPSPGSTSADLFGTAMVHLLTNGNAYIGKFRSENTIIQLACLDPSAITVEQRGGQIVYLYAAPQGGPLQELGPADVVAIKAMSSDGLRGLSPVRQAMRVLQLNQALIDYLASWLGNDSRPGGVLSVKDGAAAGMPGAEQLGGLKRDAEELYGWKANPPGHGRVAVMSGDLSYVPVDPPLREQEFIAQRELSAREVARAMGVPSWAIGASTGDSLTYSNVSQQNRFLLDHCFRPWLVRVEHAISNDADLCPGGVYLSFDTDALLRADPDARASFYAAGLEGGWLSIDEIRHREDLPPLGAGA